MYIHTYNKSPTAIYHQILMCVYGDVFFIPAVIEFKERMEHSLAAERSLNSDCASALRNQQEEQDKLLHHNAVVQVYIRALQCTHYYINVI